MDRLSVASFFSGVGGLDLGFKNQGFEFKFANDNWKGCISKTHFADFKNFIRALDREDYSINYKLLNASDYGVCQDRKRVFIVGFLKDLNADFKFPTPHQRKISLLKAIGDLPEPLPAVGKNKANPSGALKAPNHEYAVGDFSSRYMSRNRVRSWSEQSFTIQAGARHIPIHPQANKMIKIAKDKFIFDENSPKEYRRLSVRECARIQSFPDDFIFKYSKIDDVYKMIGNAVPVKLAEAIAFEIKKSLKKIKKIKSYKKTFYQALYGFEAEYATPLTYKV